MNKKYNVPIELPLTPNPVNPDSNHIAVYPKTDKKIYKRDSTGEEKELLSDLDTTLNTESSNPISNAAVAGKFEELSTITREPTGFYSQSDQFLQNIQVLYDPILKTVTLSGTFKAYYRGEVILDVDNGSWTSDPCPNEIGQRRYMLCYDGNGWDWKTYGDCFFTNLMVTYLYFRENGDFIFALRETHGMMNWEDHSKWHNYVGTTLISGGDIPAASYVLNSTVATNRRPDVSQSLIEDEDLRTLLPELTNKTYTRSWLSGLEATSVTDQTEIVHQVGTLAYTNTWNGTSWVLTELPSDQHMSVWVFALPATQSTQSQKYRYVFFSGQGYSASVEEELSRSVADLDFADLLDILPEIVFIGQIVISRSEQNWFIAQVRKLTGSRQYQVSTPAGTFLSSVYTNGTITGSGTATDPIGTTKELIPGIQITDSPEFADTLITNLASDSGTGVIPDVQYTWLGATVKSVRSFFVRVIDKLYDLNTRAEKFVTHEPSSPVPDPDLFKSGDEWHDDNSLITYKLYDDGQTKQWIQKDGYHSFVTDEADPFYPANKVVVSDPVTPDFTPVVQGNNLQQVTNKVAGLQNPNLIIDYTVPADASQIILDTDRFGNPLNITTGERIIVVFEHSFVDELGNPANNRCYYRINNIISRDYRALGSNLVSFQLLGVSGYIHYTTFQLIVDRYVHGFGSNNGELIDGSLFVGGINYFLLMKEITALNSLRLGSMDTNSKVKAGSIVKIYKL